MGKKDTEVILGPKETKKPNKVKRPPYYVSEGVAITSKKGILGPGKEVKAEYFPNGEKTLKELVEKELVEKN